MMNLKKLFKNLYKSFVFDLSASNSPLYILFLRYYSPKPDSVEAFIDALCKGQQDFFVFQAGANDGITDDPIHKFIKRDQWNGILLEPQPYVFNQFLKKTYAKNKGIVTLNAALGNEDGKAELFEISFSNDRWATGLARFDRSLLENLIQEGRIDGKIKKAGNVAPKDKSEWIKSELIDMRSPKSIFHEYNVSKIDLLMIDTEGFDFEVIKLVLLSEMLPKAIIFEDMHLSESDYLECSQMLTQFNYNFIRKGPNTIAWQKEIDDRVAKVWKSQ